MASKLLPPGFRFEPTDEEVISYYLLRRIRGHPLPAGDILDDDPLSAPPWLLLGKHGRKGDAFFFAAGRAMNGKGSRQKRSCAGGGTWEGQGRRRATAKGGGEGERLRVRVRGEEIEWQKYALNFHEEGVKGSTGWVMHEYSITSPPDLAESPLRVYRIRFSGHGKNAQKRKRDELDWGSDEEEEVYHGATRRPAVAQDDALYVGGFPSAPQQECFASLPANGDVAGSTEAGADSALPEATSSGQVDGSDPWDLITFNIDDFQLSDFDLFSAVAADAGGIAMPMVPAA
ncbi:hypothetical protein HU200_055164 [Digitaria exilis]|uniref:NAC domain-containing protein n=1 Tax=Digitaria exilis TaxID=1010633 RepID=A0A835E4X3_9POAL|nr:hypothetical protein HU200_055164 [Digitaria exilis]